MIKRRSLLLAAALCALAVPLRAADAEHVIKLGTLAPSGTSFHKVLVTMGAQWSATPGGATLRIYPGGVAGGEADMVMKMKIGQLDAALISANGLADIDRASQSLQGIPMLYRSLAEVDYIAEKLRPRLDRRLRDRGFVVLCWLDAGWVHFFSKQPVEHPAQLKQMKLFTWSGDTAVFDIYKSAGFHPVALETNDILPMLRTGMITAVPSPPYVALTTQSFAAAPYMLDVNWAPLVGALVVTERAWNKLSPEAQASMARAAAEAGARMKAENRAASDAAVEAMKKRGLHVYEPTPQVEEEWRAVAEASYPDLRGRVVPADFFDDVRRLLLEYRAAHTAAAAAAPRPR
jgi:TRAP-type C4-dicarboxylate transport system substrate-binding protein